MKKLFSLFAIIGLIVNVSCMNEENAGVNDKSEVYARLGADQDFVWLLKETEQLMHHLNAVSDTMGSEKIESIKAEIRGRYSGLSNKFKGHDLEELGMKTLDFLGKNWYGNNVLNDRGLSNSKSEVLTCGGVCSSDNLTSCGAGCTWSATNCISSGGPDYICVSSWNLCEGDCCTFFCNEQ